MDKARSKDHYNFFIWLLLFYLVSFLTYSIVFVARHMVGEYWDIFPSKKADNKLVEYMNMVNRIGKLHLVGFSNLIVMHLFIRVLNKLVVVRDTCRELVDVLWFAWDVFIIYGAVGACYIFKGSWTSKEEGMEWHSGGNLW